MPSQPDFCVDAGRGLYLIGEYWLSRAFREGGQDERARIRCRHKSNLARPYMLRLISFSRLTCPSTCPLL